MVVQSSSFVQCWLSGMRQSRHPSRMGSFPCSQPWERQPVKITVYPAWCLGWWKDPRAALPGLLLYVTGQELLSQLGLF